MADLQQLLDYLARDDVDEVRLETGAPVTVSQSGRLRPLTRHTLTADQVREIVRGTPLEPLLPTADSDGMPELIMVGGEPYIVMIARDRDRLQFRFGRSPGASSPGPAPSPPMRTSPGPRPSASPASLATRPTVAEPTAGRGSGPRPPASRRTVAEPAAGPQPAAEPEPRETPRAPTMPEPEAAPSNGWTLATRPTVDRPAGGADRPPSAIRPSRPTAAEPAVQSPAPAAPDPDAPQERSGSWTASRPAPVAPRSTTRQPAARSSASVPVVSSGRFSSSEVQPPEARPPPARAAEVPSHLVELLAYGRNIGASDVHVVAGRPVAFRVGGRLEGRGDEVPVARVQQMLEAVVPPLHAPHLQQRGYCDFGMDVQGAGRLRVNVSRQRTGLKGCFRLVATVPPTLEQLGLPHELSKVTRYHQGLAIVSGPNGQGKTTTMAALVDLLNASKPVHIITVEDPVEVVHPVKRAVISQREVGTHTRSFPAALRAALREDPDVIVIGELRDRETVEMALSAAETGHLVIATMSTPSGAKTITRLIDMFPPDDQAQVRATLAGALKIVVSQRLVPRADGRGLVAAAELITGNVPLWSLIRDDKLFQLPSLLQRGKAFGMIRIEDSLSALLQTGVIDEPVARRFADDPQGLRGVAAAAEPEPSLQTRSSWKGGLRGFFDKGGS
ncbi:MAG: PilT/PilU family type 4a pilus ATPase [Nannocystaceae bacterium]